MPRIRHPNRYSALIHPARETVVRPQNQRVDAAEVGRACIAHDHCREPLIPGAPVQLCGKHLREVYEFAQDLIADRWDGAMREYVGELQNTFKPPRAVLRRPRPGFVYFLLFGDRVKIGYSENLEQRFRDLPHDEVLGYRPGTRDDERAWHDLLDQYRVTGEWFLAEPAVLDAIRQVCAEPAAG